MAGRLAVRKLACGARVHAWVEGDRYIRRRCHDRRCQEVRWARQRGQIAIHVWDLVTGDEWTEYEPADPRSQGNGRNRHLSA